MGRLFARARLETRTPAGEEGGGYHLSSVNRP